jgi:hypothetical protein
LGIGFIRDVVGLPLFSGNATVWQRRFYTDVARPRYRRPSSSDVSGREHPLDLEVHTIASQKTFGKERQIEKMAPKKRFGKERYLRIIICEKLTKSLC